VKKYRTEPGSERNCRWSTNILPVDGEDPVQVSMFVYVKDHLRVAICELVEVDDDKIFGRQRMNNMERIFLR